MKYLEYFRQRQQAAVTSAALHRADSELLDLLGQMLAFDPRRRISAKQALRHPWLSSLADDFADDPLSGLTADLALLDIEFDDVAACDLRAFLWREIRAFHPDIGPCPRRSSE